MPIRVAGLDLDDPCIEEALVEQLSVGMVDEFPGYCVLPIFVDPSTFIRETLQFVTELRKILPQVKIIGLDRDFVNVSDIAERVGVTRECARLWSLESDFPFAFSRVGKQGQKVWEWCDITSWLSKFKLADLGRDLLHREEIVELENALMRESKTTKICISPQKWQFAAKEIPTTIDDKEERPLPQIHTVLSSRAYMDLRKKHLAAA